MFFPTFGTSRRRLPPLSVQFSIALFLNAFAFGQNAHFEINPVNTTDFTYQHSVFDWQYKLGHGGRYKRLSFVGLVNITTSLIDDSEGKKWKDNQIGLLKTAYAFNSSVNFLTQFEHQIFRDELSSFNFDRNESFAKVGVMWRFKKSFNLQPEAGYKWERRAAIQEGGPHLSLGGRLENLKVSEARHNFDGFFSRTFFPQRQNGDVRFTYSFFREFQPGTSDSLEVFLDGVRRDNYVSFTQFDRVESLRKRQQGVRNHLTYRAGANSAILLNTTITSGRVDFRELERGVKKAARAHNDFFIENDLRYHLALNKIQWQAGLKTSESSITYDLQDSTGFTPFSRRFASFGYDLTTRATNLSQRLSMNAGAKDRLRFFAELTKLEHNNSDSLNPDTFDEQRLQVALSHERKLTQRLTFSWELSAFLKHFVYLNSRLSSQNNKSRFLQIQPEIRYNHSKRVAFVQRAAVRAQYTEFDFDQFSASINSYVVRNFFLYDSLALPISDKIDMTLNYRLEIEELGNLNWAEFSSRPQSELLNHWFSLKFSQKFSRAMRFSSGAAIYRQTRRQFLVDADGELLRDPLSTLTNVGPFVEFDYLAKNGSILHFFGQRQKVFPFQGESYFLNDFQLSVQWTF